MRDPEDGPGWEQQEELERRRFEEAQRLLREDAEAYQTWLREVESEALGAD